VGLKSWLAENRQDEREMYLYGRAGSWAFIAMSFALLAIAIVNMVQGRIEQALEVIPALSLGQVVYFGLILRWKAAR